MRGAVLLLIAATACGGDAVEVTRLAGSPRDTRALAFDDAGTPVAIGGTTAFGLAYLQQRDGEGWRRADGIAAFDAHALLVGGGARPLYALSETQLHRLADPLRFAWETFAIPVGTTADTAFGVDDAGRVYALELQPDGAGAVHTWLPGETRWAELPGSRQIGVGATDFIVDGAGRVTWSVPDAGIVRLAEGIQTTLAACDAIGTCGMALRALADDGTHVFALACGETARVLRDGVEIGALAGDGCHGLASADGRTIVHADALYAAGDDLERVTGADALLAYIVRDASTAFGYGDGIYQVSF